MHVTARRHMTRPSKQSTGNWLAKLATRPTLQKQGVQIVALMVIPLDVEPL